MILQQLICRLACRMVRKTWLLDPSLVRHQLRMGRLMTSLCQW